MPFKEALNFMNVLKVYLAPPSNVLLQAVVNISGFYSLLDTSSIPLPVAYFPLRAPPNFSSSASASDSGVSPSNYSFPSIPFHFCRTVVSLQRQGEVRKFCLGDVDS